MHTSGVSSPTVVRLQACTQLPFKEARHTAGKSPYYRERESAGVSKIQPEMNLVETIDLYAIPCGYCQAGASQAMVTSWLSPVSP